MNDNESYEFESRRYINPTLSSGEQEAFISNLRDIQNKNNAQIQEQTYNLGTQVPSNLGGLGGGEAYFTARYQTPQVDEMVATLDTAAKAQALQDVMSNYQAQLKNRYSQAQRAYRKRQAAKARAAAMSPTTGGKEGGIELEDSTDAVTLEHGVGGWADSNTPAGRYTTQAVDESGKYYVTTDDNGNVVSTNEPKNTQSTINSLGQIGTGLVKVLNNPFRFFGF